MQTDTVPLVDDAIRAGYSAEGKLDEYDSVYSVRFIGERKKIAQVAAAAIVEREKCAGNVLIGGFGGGEVTALLEAGAKQKCIQIAGSPKTGASVGMIVAVADYVMFPEEYYALGAYISKDPKMSATIGAVDIIKYIVIAAMIAGTVLFTLGNTSILHFLQI